MSERFFLESPPQAGRGILVGDEARHLARVLRARVGDGVRVFDGTGGEWLARVAAIGRDEVTLEIGAALEDAPVVVPTLTLAVALPKGERQKWLVEKLTELGVARLVPLVTVRGVAEATPAARDRLRRGAIEACKQCGRSVLMEIGQPVTVAEACAGSVGPALLCDPHGPPLDTAPLRGATMVLGLVGPEGGFTPEEAEAAVTAGAVRARLAPHVLRVETAAVALAAAVTVGSRGPAPA